MRGPVLCGLHLEFSLNFEVWILIILLMLTLTFYPDTNRSVPVILCNTSRSLTEMNLRLNQRRGTEIFLGYGAAYATAIDRGNVRNVLSVDVRRDSDYTPAKFPDPEGALVFALDHPNYLPGTGTLKLSLTGVTTSATRWLLNCSLDTLEMPDWLGTAPLFKYTFNGGAFTATAPF